VATGLMSDQLHMAIDDVFDCSVNQEAMHCICFAVCLGSSECIRLFARGESVAHFPYIFFDLTSVVAARSWQKHL
jgi:hypothetical protein